MREVEHGAFTPLVFTAGGGAAPEATVCLKRLSGMLADKRGIAHSATMGWLRCAIGFCLLRSSLLGIRASHRTRDPSVLSMDIA